MQAAERAQHRNGDSRGPRTPFSPLVWSCRTGCSPFSPLVRSGGTPWESAGCAIFLQPPAERVSAELADTMNNTSPMQAAERAQHRNGDSRGPHTPFPPLVCSRDPRSPFSPPVRSGGTPWDSAGYAIFSPLVRSCAAHLLLSSLFSTYPFLALIRGGGFGGAFQLPHLHTLQ